ncbi:Formate dehydrogenase O putative subunit [Cystobacter fuscus DSM 2262]|uniref:Formate dehydrogenase O putative subunit n=1 Tax=Cystobacter fuscus (strain ATCC 25194 / DSM 2262 / NBRC 100088 / M29) TaxID=1242864 RepID=S9QRD3_CYSF2|nr:NrfD/PsrC family molybdoenzyme membrane anchor subunit [Cystobacter fuscus]EPX63869.1 Formate dehydrogenase O putative subunit [Cystobacter fuscus DSM 2262]
MSKGIRPEDLDKRGDGREIDTSRGELSGEGAWQRVKRLDEANPARAVLHTRPTPSDVTSATPSYYGQPVLKEPIWIWTIPLYFYVGGTAGAASLLGATAEVLGGERLRPLGVRCRWIGAVGDSVSAGLLIYDLGRPERFLHMLRVFRPTSPMNLGTWILSGSGAMNGAAAVLSGQKGWLGRAGDGAALIGGLLGMPLAGYTAVLITNTSVALWQSVHKSLPLLFMASSVAGAGSLLRLLPHKPEEERILHLFGMGGKVAALAAGLAAHRDATRVEAVGKPLHQGWTGAMWVAAHVCTAASLGMDLVPGRRRPAMKVAAAVLGTAGELFTRFAMFYAGKKSSRDAQATFQGQRQGLGAAEVTGHTLASDGKPLKFPLPVLK